MDRETFRDIQRLLEPLRRQIALVATKAVIKAIKDSGGLQQLQATMLADDVADESTEHMQPGGLSHVPLAGAEGVFLTVAGVRDDGVLIAVSNRANRPKNSAAGETVVYNAGDRQSTIRLMQDGSIVARSGGSNQSTITMDADGNITVSSAAGRKVTINTVEIDANGNLSAPGEVTAKSGSPGTSVKLSTHLHGHPMGPTSGPTPGT